MDMESVLKCNICTDDYDDVVRPRTLPCGHSFCGSCITNSINSRTLKCPNCQKFHKASSGNYFAINFGMEAIISEMKKGNLGAIPKQPSKRDSQPSHSRHKWQEFFSEQKDSLKDLIQTTEEIKTEMLHYQEFVNQRKQRHENLNSKIDDLSNQNNAMIKQFEAEQKKLDDFLKLAEDHKKKATDTLNRFYQVISTKDIITGSDEVASCHENLDEWQKQSQMELPDATTIISSDKLYRNATALFSDLYLEDAEGSESPLNLSESSLPIMDKIKRITKAMPLTLRDLKSKSEFVKELLEKDLVLAVQSKEGKIRSARISIDNYKIFLHHLKDEEPPFNAYTIQHCDLIESLDTSSVEVFLDLCWDRCNQGRVHIDLSPETPLAKHFLMLCSGTLGPSYAHSNFLQVENKDDEGNETVIGGDYEFNDGTGGAALFSGLNPQDHIYERDCVEGSVCTRFTKVGGNKIAQFEIQAGNEINSGYSGVFGHVKDGLEIVMKAVSVDDIRQVKISNCGVILSI